MENWTQRIFLVKTLFVFGVVSSMMVSGLAYSQEKPLIEPDVKPQVVDESLIDTENFEIGLFAGVINIEDFESSMLYGARLAYHLSEDLFFEAHVGQAAGGKTSAEKLSNINLISDSDRDYLYYNFGVGYNILPGEAFVAGKYSFNTNIYLATGIGATNFADDNRLTYNVGVGLQVLLNDWLSVHVSTRKHLYKIDLTGEDKVSVNSESSLGLSVFF